MKIWRPKTLKSRSNFVVGFVIGAVLFSGSAYAVSNYVSDNTPENGYLLCANKSTKAVTFPNKLSCPSGTIALDMGAATGIDGVDGVDGSDGTNGYNGINGLTGPAGPAGATGPAGASTGGKLYWGVSSSSIDIVADGTINSSSAMVKKIMYVLKATDVPSGYYQLHGVVSGLWADSASTGSLLKCYFQDSTKYNLDSSSTRWGGASVERQYWSGASVNIFGDWVSSSDPLMYLVCKTSGTLKGLNVEVEAMTASIGGQLP